jgi:hypothetical protein
VAAAPETPVPVTHLSFTQELVGQVVSGSPYVLKIVVQTDRVIDKLKLFVLFRPGDTPSLLEWRPSNSMTANKRNVVTSTLTVGNAPAIYLECTCEPTLSPETPFVIVVQSPSSLRVQGIVQRI